MTTTNKICPKIAGLVQHLNSVHTLCAIGDFKKATAEIGIAQGLMQSAAHDIWLQHHVSGTVDSQKSPQHKE